jgi:hypothetical protein
MFDRSIRQAGYGNRSPNIWDRFRRSIGLPLGAQSVVG